MIALFGRNYAEPMLETAPTVFRAVRVTRTTSLAEFFSSARKLVFKSAPCAFSIKGFL